jgi:Ca-activated chloride channel homolog
VDTAQSEKPAAGAPAAAAPALPERQQTALRNYLRHLSHDDADQTEAVLAQLAQDLQKRGKSALTDDPMVWLFREGRRLMIEFGLKSDAREESGQPEEEVVLGENLRAVVHRTIHQLTPKQEEALRLKFQFGFKLGEVAHITRLSDQAASGLLHLAVTRVGRAICTAKGSEMPSVGDTRLIPYAFDELNPADKNDFIQSSSSSKALLESVEAVRDWCTQIRPALTSKAPRSSRRRSGAGGWTAKLVGAGLVIVVGVAGLVYFLRQPETAVKRPWQATGANGIGSLPDAVERRRLAPEKNERMKTDSQAGSTRAAIKTAAARPSGQGPDRTTLPASVDDVPVLAGGDQGGQRAAAVADEPQRAVPRNRRKIPTTPVSRERNPSEGRGAMGALEPEQPDDRTKQPLEPEGAFAADDAATGNVAADRRAEVMPREKPARTSQPIEQGDLGEGGDAGREDADPDSKIDQKVGSPSTPGQLRHPLGGRLQPNLPVAKTAVLLRQVPMTTAGPNQTEPLEATMEQAPSPWNPSKRIVRVSLRAKDVPFPARPVANVVFAVDISQSMTANARLDLVREGIRRLMERLRPEDQVAIVTYSDRADVALPTTSAARSGVVRSCLVGLVSAGRTNGSEGLMLAYQVVRSGWIEGGLNEVVLCTDGNFNLGTTDEKELAAIAAEQASRGIRLSVIGFGRNDRNDLRLELLATNGGGRSGYVNTQAEAEQMLVGQLNGLFVPVASSVRMHVEFSPENVLEARRLDDESALAGTNSVDRLLPGRSLTQLYEITPRYADPAKEVRVNLVVNCTLAATAESKAIVQELAGTPREWVRTGVEFRHATAILDYARILRGDPRNAPFELGRLKRWIQENLADDPDGYRRDLLFKLEQAGGQEVVGLPSVGSN